MRIIIVDDAAFMRALLKDHLISLGHEIVAEGRNGHEGVHLYKQYKPDLVTMDITMPELDGILALKEIIKFDPRASVIMCSAMGQQKLVIDSIRAGAKDFLVKPFNKDRIGEAVDRIWGAFQRK
ncbi:two-component system response regulator [Paenibacillus pectinilyticus]|uniref:Two-component system response regulator n=1 Tax=Paenibacillus pectinilyticus TaxID=512399 RepID=A0A1C0ZSW5_9BACL|nr:response regulator [Paenibacillus pectinilyticus]OCT11172.1 two-component system response regulator [Paenibacillus pectinilyticus]